MVNSGLIICFDSNKAIVITDDRRYLKIPRENSMYIGKKVTFDTEAAVIKTNVTVTRMAYAASILLLISIIVFFSPIRNFVMSANEYAYICVDINPSMEFVIDKEGKVLKVISLNHDAERIAKDIDLRGKHIEGALKAFLMKAVQSEVKKEDRLVLITASLKNDEISSNRDDLDNLIRPLKSAVCSLSIENFKVVTVKASPENVRESRSRGISTGKSVLLNSINDSGANISIEEALGMPLTDLVQMYLKIAGNRRNGNIDIDYIGIKSSGHTENKPEVTMYPGAQGKDTSKPPAPPTPGKGIDTNASLSTSQDMPTNMHTDKPYLPKPLSSTNGIIPGKYYRITAKHSNKAMSMPDNSADNGAKALQYDFSGSDNQIWRIDAVGGGYYKLTAKQSGKCLSVKDGSLYDGAELVQSVYTGADNQKFILKEVEAGYYAIIAKHSGKCIDVCGGYTGNSILVWQWSYLNGNNQKWQIVDIGSSADSGKAMNLTTPSPNKIIPPKGINTGRYYKIAAKHSGKAMSVSDGSLDEGAKVIQYGFSGEDNQIWKIDAVGGGDYKLTAKHSGKCLSVKDGDLNNGAQLVQSHYTGADNQKFILKEVEKGCFVIMAKHSGKYICISGGYQSDNIPVSQWNYLDGDNQKWVVVEIE